MKKWLLGCLLILSISSVRAQKPYAIFNHIGIDVRNMDKSESFYRLIFQLDSIPNPWPNRKMKWFKIGDHDQLHIIQADSNEKITPENFHFAFSVRPLDAFITRLQQQHIPYEDGNGKASSITLRPDGVKQIYIKDPDGYTVEINDQKY
jgi:lactoylglutathione lyase